MPEISQSVCTDSRLLPTGLALIATPGQCGVLAALSPSLQIKFTRCRIWNMAPCPCHLVWEEKFRVCLWDPQSLLPLNRGHQKLSRKAWGLAVCGSLAFSGEKAESEPTSEMAGTGNHGRWGLLLNVAYECPSSGDLQAHVAARPSRVTAPHRGAPLHWTLKFKFSKSYFQ